MSKKNKERDSYWDIDDQQAAADAFFEFESGNAELPIKEDEIDANGIAGPLANLIAKDLFEGKNTKCDITPVDTPEYIDFEDVQGFYTECELDSFDLHDGDSIEDGTKIRPITSEVYEAIGRVCIDDHISPTSYIKDLNMECENIEYYCTDERASCFISKLWEYIFSLKHPTAVYTFEEFIEMFGNVKTYSMTNFVMFADEITERIYAYCIDVESIYKTNKYAAEKLYSDDVIELTRFFISLAYAAGRSDQVFFVDDPEYVERFRLSEYNQKDLFAKVLLNHEQTKINDEFNTDIHYIREQLDIHDITKLQGSVRSEMSYIIGDSDDDELDDSDVESSEVEKVDEQTEESTEKTMEEETIDEEEDEEDINLTIDDSEEVELPKEEPKVEEVKKSESVETKDSNPSETNAKKVDTDDSSTNTIKVVRKVR